MFSFSKKKKLVNNIGTYLHAQLLRAAQENNLADQRINEMFSSGYIYGLTAESFRLNGYDWEQLTEKYLEHICNGVYPNKLFNIVQNCVAKMTLIDGIEKLTEKMKEEKLDFNNGISHGRKDATTIELHRGSYNSGFLYFYLTSDGRDDFYRLDEENKKL